MANKVTKATFQEEVINKKGVVLVDFFAEWCGPCKMVAPIIDELSKEREDASFVKVNVDEEGELAQEYGISSIPTFVVFKDGKVVSQFMGAQGKESFEEAIDKAKNA
ncbi:MAG: thioredoxin [Patescibacteria group bacterium]